MAWTAVASPYFSTGQVVNATNMNALSDNLRYLKGTDGDITLDSNLGVGDSTPTSDSTLSTTRLASVSAGSGSTTAALYLKGSRSGADSAVGQLAGINLSATGSDKRAGAISFLRDTAADSGQTVLSARNASGALTDYLYLKRDGKIGFGTNAPAGPLHMVGSLARWAAYEFDGLAGTTQVVVPDGTGDVVYGLLVTSLVRGSGGIVQVGNSSGTVIVPGGNTAIYSNASDIATLRVTAAGQIEIQRTGGTLTYKVALWLQWI